MKTPDFKNIFSVLAKCNHYAEEAQVHMNGYHESHEIYRANIIALWAALNKLSLEVGDVARSMQDGDGAGMQEIVKRKVDAIAG